MVSSFALANTYAFTGTGNWNDATHWKQGLIPPPHTLSDIVISGNVTYTSGLTLSSGSTLTITSGSTFTLQADVLHCQCGDGGLWFQGATINVQTGATFNCKDWIYSYGTLNVDGMMTCRYVFADAITTNTTINGTLEVGGTGVFAVFRGPITINNGGVLRIKTGTVFESSNSITVNSGGLLNHQGTLKGNATIIADLFTNSATLSPGTSPGTINITGNYASTGTADHIMELGGSAAGTFDQINVSGTVALNGTLNASLYGGFNPSTSHDIAIITASSVSGAFSSVNVPAGYTVVYNPTNVTLRFTGLLPVNFINVEVKKEGNAAAMIWKVENEQNVSRYEIEKSSDGIKFEKIGSVPATGLPVYSFIDFNVQSKNYYRIKSVDINTGYKYSPVLRVSGGQQTVLLSAFPSPATSEITIQHPVCSSNSKILISSIDGRNVLNVLSNRNALQSKVNISNLRPGVYIVRYEDNNQTQSLKIIKQ